MGGRGTTAAARFGSDTGKAGAAAGGAGAGGSLDDRLNEAWGLGRSDRDSVSEAHWNGNFDAFFSTSAIGGGAAATAQNLFGEPVTAKQIGMLLGAPDGAEVVVRTYGNGKGLEVEVVHPFFDSLSRSIYKDEKGNLTIENVIFQVNDFDQRAGLVPRGLGGRMLAYEGAAARAMGIKRIVTDAAGNYADRDAWSGYYVWARLGFNSKIEDFQRDRILNTLSRAGYRDTPVFRDVQRVKTLNDLFKADGKNARKGIYSKYGIDREKHSIAQLWKVNGSAFEGVFDLDERSVSSRVLGRWMKETGVRGANFGYKAKKLKVYT